MLDQLNKTESIIFPDTEKKVITVEDRLNFYKHLFDSLADGIIVLNKNKQIIYYNNQFESLFGFKPERNTPILNLAGTFRSKIDLQTFIEKLLNEKSGTVDLLLKKKGNEIAKFEVTGTFLEDYLILYMRSRLGSEFDDLMRLHADRIETIRHVNSQLSHEIRSPLTSIYINLEHLEIISNKFNKLLNESENECKERSQCKKFASDIIGISTESLERLNYTIEVLKNLSAYSRLGKVDEDIIDIGEVVETTLKIIQKASKIKDLPLNQLISDLDELKGIKAKANKMWLSQVLWNLCMNAYEAIENNGIIKIIGKVTLSYINIQILNTGHLPDDELESIFMPHFSSKKGNQGLGLAIVRNIMHLSHGSVWASNSPDNKWVVLHIQLPIYDDNTSTENG